MANPYRNFTAYVQQDGMAQAVLDSYEEGLNAFKGRAAQDPGPTSWRRLGFNKKGNEYITRLEDSDNFLLRVEVRERILPSNVIKKALDAKINEIRKIERRKATKKEIAEYREGIIGEMLPQAFIRSTIVPVMFVQEKYLLIFATSIKRCEDVIALLKSQYDAFNVRKYQTVNRPGGVLTAVAKGQTVDSHLEADDAATLRGTDGNTKRTIRVKDRDILSHEVQQLLRDYAPIEMTLKFYEHAHNKDEPQEPIVYFKLSDTLLFKSVHVSHAAIQAHMGDDEEDKAMDEHVTAWILGNTFATLLDGVATEMGGLGEGMEVESEEEDDEF